MTQGTIPLGNTVLGSVFRNGISWGQHKSFANSLVFFFKFICLFILKFTFSNLYTKHGSWTYDPEIKSHALFQLANSPTS